MTPNEQSALIRLAREAGCSETWGADSFRFTIEELQRFAELVRNQALEDCADVCQKAGYLAMDIHIRDLIRKSKQQVFADVIGKMKS